MRIAAFFLFFCAFCAVAENVNSQNAKVSIHKSNVPLEEILNEIEAQTDYLFIYHDAVNVKQKASVNVSGKPVSEVLRSLLEAGLVNSQLTGKHIILSDVPAKTVEGEVTQSDRKITVTGRIIDQTGESVIGAAVLEKGTSNGVVTDLDGNFSLKVDAGTTLVITYIGYVPQELKAVSGKKMNIQLKEDMQMLDEVVVLGYTTQSRNTLTGSAVALNEKKLKDVSTASVSSMLDGKVAGVNISTKSGKPGETSKVQIRGKGSLGSSLAPIWVVDGIIYNDDPRLSPNEIENLTVLKDASSTALYGSRASNGVIVITTKKGGIDRQKFNVNVQQGLSELSWGNLQMMDAQQLYDYASTFNSSSWFKPSLLEHDTDWLDLATRTGLYTNVNVSYQGGNEKLDSYLLLDYYRETAAVRDMDYNRFTLRSNNDYKIGRNFKAFTKLQGQYVKTKDQSASIGSYLYLPWDFPYNEDGSIRTGRESDWNGRDKNNYMESREKNYGSYENFYVSATAGFNLTLMQGLTFESNNNVNYKIARDETYVDPKTLGGTAKSGTIKNAYSITSNYFTNQMLRYQTLLNEKHSIQALAAYEFSRYFYQGSSATAKGITAGKEVIDGTTGMDDMSGSKSAFNVQSFLSNVNYAYDGRYMVQASYRLDGSSKFGTNHQYGSFYTFSGGWNINRETFFAPLSTLFTEAKLRASWGVVGNTPDGNYNHHSLYTAGMYYGLPANFPSQMGNEDLSWEKTQTTNVGLDLSLFNRVRFSFDYYNKYTSDLLYFVQLSTITGYDGRWQNIGSVQNRGFEVSADATIVSNKEWSWNIGLNLSTNQNRIDKLYGGLPQISGFVRRFEEGRDMDELWMAEWAGVDQETGAPLWYTTDEEGQRVLTKSYTEANSSRVYVGSAAPKVFGGFNTYASWKGLSLQASFAYSLGAKLYAAGRELLDSDGAYDTYNQMVLKDGWSRWHQSGDVATHPKAVSGGNANSNKLSSRYLENANYLAMKNLTIAYELPKSILSSLGVNTVTLSFSADNLFTITPYSQVDPAASSYNSDGIGGSDVYPIVRKYVFGLNVSF